ncbi:hypothetical protein Tco_0656292 [Tanacetum coccineum]|uniref:Uncharacterized protein n=1 Tax=Tanacetum coccineum TaxID=301880 RepID=A0ABQ4X913_9ASTR
MDTIRAQQQALDDELVTPADLVLDALKLTLFYNAFEISADVPEIYMQEFWVTVSRHHSSLCFKLNAKSHTVNVEDFRDMLKICPKLPSQKFEEPPPKEDILSFIRDLGHTGEIKFLSDVNVNHMHQPWRSFATIINKCISGKTTALESLRLSRAQILWGMYHNKTVDYVYLLWEDLMFQVENKNSKKNNDMDDFMFTIVRVISKHQDTQVYGAILPQHLTNQAMLESEAYMTYRAYATGEKTPKPKTTKKKADSEAYPKTKTTQATKGKIIKSSAKGDKSAKKKQPAETSMDKGLTVLYDIALIEAEQLKLVIERSKKQTHSSQASSLGADEGTDDEDEVNVSKKYDDNDNNDDDDDVDNQDDENQLMLIPHHTLINPIGQQQSSSGPLVSFSNFLNHRPDTVKEQVKAQVSKILPKIEKTVNEQLEAKVITHLSTESKTSLAIAANLSDLELKKILIEKIENNKSINISNEQKNLYKALVEAYESDKLILDTYGDTVAFKRRRDDEDKDEETSARSN